MNQLIFGVLCVAMLASSVSARYILVPIEDIQEYGYPMRQARTLYYPAYDQFRARRSPIPDEEKIYIKSEGDSINRREDLLTDVPASFIVPASLRSEIEPETSASSTYSKTNSPNYVDYGAYTGGYGSFGWYSDHPVVTSGFSHNGYHS
ncbi:unnamed protein product [Lepeophtheirus salmonis]|uniref:(salmon louse) hypothetical protein n=2 Tax=Lepeophtheirus salmonis TaxID=72036 RepID=A0A7R8H399_LEPSM|nr:uncharacterized protein LOC121129140 [Lepeophtheirus salmonis]CAB4058896.1 unnamed protein product [Lepeophtheirus salmonis]CAF2841039.1 unnamed protein product [Lepeophtheirus salmonis]